MVFMNVFCFLPTTSQTSLAQGLVPSWPPPRHPWATWRTWCCPRGFSVVEKWLGFFRVQKKGWDEKTPERRLGPREPQKPRSRKSGRSIEIHWDPWRSRPHIKTPRLRLRISGIPLGHARQTHLLLQRLSCWTGEPGSVKTTGDPWWMSIFSLVDGVLAHGLVDWTGLSQACLTASVS